MGDNNALRMKTVWKAIYLPEYQWYFYFLLALYKNFQRRIIIITDGDTNGVIFFGFERHCEWGTKPLEGVLEVNLPTLLLNIAFTVIPIICCVTLHHYRILTRFKYFPYMKSSSSHRSIIYWNYIIASIIFSALFCT